MSSKLIDSNNTLTPLEGEALLIRPRLSLNERRNPHNLILFSHSHSIDKSLRSALDLRLPFWCCSVEQTAQTRQ